MMGEKYDLVTSLEYDAVQLEADGLPIAAKLKHSEAESVKELIEALDNLIIAIGMGWDLEGVCDVGKSAVAKARGEQS